MAAERGAKRCAYSSFWFRPQSKDTRDQAPPPPAQVDRQIGRLQAAAERRNLPLRFDNLLFLGRVAQSVRAVALAGSGVDEGTEAGSCDRSVLVRRYPSSSPAMVGNNSQTVGWMCIVRANVSTSPPAAIISSTAWIASSPPTPRIAAPRIARLPHPQQSS